MRPNARGFILYLNFNRKRTQIKTCKRKVFNKICLIFNFFQMKTSVIVFLFVVSMVAMSTAQLNDFGRGLLTAGAFGLALNTLNRPPYVYYPQQFGPGFAPYPYPSPFLGK